MCMVIVILYWFWYVDSYFASGRVFFEAIKYMWNGNINASSLGNVTKNTKAIAFVSAKHSESIIAVDRNAMCNKPYVRVRQQNHSNLRLRSDAYARRRTRKNNCLRIVTLRQLHFRIAQFHPFPPRHTTCTGLPCCVARPVCVCLLHIIRLYAAMVHKAGTIHAIGSYVRRICACITSPAVAAWCIRVLLNCCLQHTMSENSMRWVKFWMRNKHILYGCRGIVLTFFPCNRTNIPGAHDKSIPYQPKNRRCRLALDCVFFHLPFDYFTQVFID